MKTWDNQRFSNVDWLTNNTFSALAEISSLLIEDETRGRDALIRVLEHREKIQSYREIISSLTQKAGLYPYLNNSDRLSIGDLLNLEFHRVDGMEEIVLHSMQAKVYRTLLNGENVILSAPTSFGKSLLIDAMIASRRFKNIVVIVPTIALIDETRRRLSSKFRSDFKIITQPSQSVSERNIHVLTQERFVEFEDIPHTDFFVVDEYYKLSPERGDERTFILNHAFYKLLKSGAQFFLIGPNVSDLTIDQTHIEFKYFGTDFTTVATEISFHTDKSNTESAIKICKELKEPTLIFCRSSNSAYKLAEALITAGVSASNPAIDSMVEWLSRYYPSTWILTKLLKHGIAVHHGSLPRSLAYQLLRKFNDGDVRFLLCTSTIIEGVNTSAKNIVIYDSEIARKKFDQFTFNNIKGRAGRMLKHFVGHVYVLHERESEDLPLVDMPSLTQPESAPESLLIQIEDRDLSEHSLEKLKYLHSQDILPMEILRSNIGIEPHGQIDLASAILKDFVRLEPLLSWHRFPTYKQLQACSELIFEYIMRGRGRDGIGSAKHLCFKINQFARTQSIEKLIEAALNDERAKDDTEAIESTLMFIRRWVEHRFPRYLRALDSIQRTILEKKGYRPGNYDYYATSLKQLFMPLSATLLEEYGLPYQVSQKVEKAIKLGEDSDTIISNVRTFPVGRYQMHPFESEMLKDTIENI